MSLLQEAALPEGAEVLGRRTRAKAASTGEVDTGCSVAPPRERRLGGDREQCINQSL